MAARAVAAAAGVAREHGLRVEDPVVLHDVFSVRVHLRPAPVVARVPTWISRLRPAAGNVARELEVASFLVDSGAPVIAPSPELPAGPHHRDGFPISFWTFTPADPDRPPATAADCAALLPDLHAALRGYPGPLPALGAVAMDLPGWLARLDALDPPIDTLIDPLIDAADHARLLAAADRLRPLLDPDPGDQPLHGDAHAGNLVATRRGLVWNDFEEVCRGPAEWDWATIGDPAAVRDRGPDPDRLVGYGQLRALQVALCLILLRPTFADLPGWDDGIRGCLAALDT